MAETSSREVHYNEFLKELQEKFTDPIHKRLIQSYRGERSSALHLMELELSKILLEVLHHED